MKIWEFGDSHSAGFSQTAWFLHLLRSLRSSLRQSWGHSPAVPSGREPYVPWATLPAATQCRWPAAMPWRTQPCVRCHCESDTRPASSNAARRGFILPDFNLPTGMPKSPSGPCIRERCLQPAVLSSMFCCFVHWCGQHQVAKASQVSGVSGVPLAVHAHPPLGSSEVQDEAIVL